MKPFVLSFFFPLQELICHFSNRGKNIKGSTKVHFRLPESSIFICISWPIGHPPPEKCFPSWYFDTGIKTEFWNGSNIFGVARFAENVQLPRVVGISQGRKTAPQRSQHPCSEIGEKVKSKVRRNCSIVVAVSTVFLEVNPLMPEGDIHTPLTGVGYNLFEASCFILHNHAKFSLFLTISPVVQIMGAPCQSLSWIKDPESCPCCLAHQLALVSGARESFCSQKASPWKQV